MGNKSITSWILFFLLALVWGSSFILMKKSSEELTGWQIGSTRIFAAGLIFFPFALFHISKIPIRKLHIVILSGMLGNLFPAFLFATAIEKMNSSLAGILNSLTPLFVVILGILFFKAKVERRKMLGVLIGLAGLVVLNLSKGPLMLDDLNAVLMILVATMMYGLNVNLVGYYLKEVDGIKVATVSMSFIAIPAGIIMYNHHVFDLWQHDGAARTAIYLAILLGVVGSAIATALFYVLIQKSGTLFASLVTYVMPIVAIGWGLLAGEDIGVMQVGCLMMILGGVYLANRP